jgi:mevalonate kinase
VISHSAKCILSGEHTVLNGGTAIVSPLKAYKTTLEYQESSLKLEMFFNKRPFTQGILSLLQSLALLPNTFSGILNVNSNIPQASGLGSSAALCVAMANLLVQHGYILAEKIFEVARMCENLFHGKSSGVDIAGVMSDKVLLYSMNNGPKSFVPTWQPKLYVSYSGVPSNTKQAVAKVRKYRDSSIGSNVDQNMESATQQIYNALTSVDLKTRLQQLRDGLNQSSECFEEWGLIGDFLRNHQNKLIQCGALAAKPTGSGEGGHVLSLWQELPPSHLNLVPVSL